MARKVKRGTRQSSFNKRRKGVLAVVIPWVRRFGIGLAVTVGLIWVGAWLHLSGSLARAGDWADERFEIATADMGFKVENILVEGRQYSDTGVLLAIVNVQKGDPLFAFDPQSAKDSITRIGWVEDVQVERRWPDTIYIGLKERQPLALWQSDKRLKLLDNKGEVIATDNLQRFSDLILVSGKGSSETAAQLVGNLKAEPIIFERVETAQRISERRWNLRLKNALEIKLPEEDIGLALRRLSTAQEEDGLLDKNIVSIDMREIDRISVRTKPGAVQEYSSGLKIEAKAGNDI